MVKVIAIAAMALAVATSAQAMSAPPLHRSGGMSTEAQHVGYRYRSVVRGYGGYGRYGYGGYRRYGYGGFRHYGYGGYRHYGYGLVRPYSYGLFRPYGYGVARRQVRRCALWGVGQVCRRWY